MEMPESLWHEASARNGAGHLLWTQPATWMPEVAAVVQPMLVQGTSAGLGHPDAGEWYIDDDAWLDLIEEATSRSVDELVIALAGHLEPLTLRVFHACRTDDAGSYFRDGLRAHDRGLLQQELRNRALNDPGFAIVRDQLESLIETHRNVVDHGRCHVSLDPRVLIEHAGHYLIYGSEYQNGVLGSHRHLLERAGVPTIIEIDLPLRRISPQQLLALSKLILREWVRLTCLVGRAVARNAFSFIIHGGLPPECVVDHSHPPVVKSPAYGTYRSNRLDCVHCGLSAEVSS